MTIHFRDNLSDPWGVNNKELVFEDQGQSHVITAVMAVWMSNSPYAPDALHEAQAKLYQLPTGLYVVLEQKVIELSKVASRELFFFQSLDQGQHWTALERALPLSEQYLIAQAYS